MEAAVKEKPLNRDAIKYIAMLTMFLNHVANVFLTHGTFLFNVLVDIGYFTAPTMCYFLVEGYQHTRSKRNYGLRLLVFALISQVPFMLATTHIGYIRMNGFNMIFTLFLCFLILVVDEKIPWRWVRVLLKTLLTLATGLGDWPLFAAGFTMLFSWAGKDRRRIAVSYLLMASAFGLLNLSGLEPQSILSAAASTLGIFASCACILFLYNGKRAERGQNFSKWFFYLFYPVHLLCLGILRIALMQ